MFKKKRPRQKQEEEQPMYPNYSPWGPPPGYGYGYPPPPPMPSMQPPQYVVMPPPPPKHDRRARRDWMSRLEDKFYDDVEKKLNKDDKPKEKQFSKWELMFFLTFGSMIIFPLQAFAYKTIVTFLKAIPY